MHWGTEFTFVPNNEQKELAKYLSDLGVNIVVGSHSHSIQPIEMIGNTLVYYSLGNFVSADDDIARTPKGQETFDNAYQFGLLSKIKLELDNDNNITFKDIKAEPIINYFDSSMKNFELVPFSDYTTKYEQNHYRYSLGLTHDFINKTFNDVIEEKYR
jgi:poly-gamma-glutamate synthesis protein (capsule biosynthesis protein)